MQIIRNSYKRCPKALLKEETVNMLGKDSNGDFRFTGHGKDHTFTVVLTEDDLAFIVRSAKRMKRLDLDLMMRA